MQRIKMFLTVTVLFSFLLSFNVQAQENVLNFTDRQIPKGVLKQIAERGKGIPSSKSNGKNWGNSINVVTLMGKTNHFGMDISVEPPEFLDYHATVPGVRVWISEYPMTRDLEIQTDETGWWTMHIVKYEDTDLEFSFVYEKEGWITTKSNVITITDEDNTDLAIHYIDPDFYNYAMKPYIIGMVRAVYDPDFVFENAMVVTVGKSWASLHDDRLPHGDPGALSSVTPHAVGQTIGPVYFNEAVVPDPFQFYTSVDGGVSWFNIPLGDTYFVSAEKPEVTYETVKFSVEVTDVVDGVELYIASPPDSVQGDNDSPPGDY